MNMFSPKLIILGAILLSLAGGTLLLRRNMHGQVGDTTRQATILADNQIGDIVSVTNVSPKLSPKTQVSPKLSPSVSVSPSRDVIASEKDNSDEMNDTKSSVTPTPSPSISMSPTPSSQVSVSPTPSSTQTPTPWPTPSSSISPTPSPVSGLPPVVVNEIAWMGTESSTADEWIELYNAGGQTIDLAGWTLSAEDGTPLITLENKIDARGFYLLERGKDDNSISDILADQTYTGALGNSGERLELRNASGDLIDAVECVRGDNGSCSSWFAGDNASKASMERISANISGLDPTNWSTNNGATMSGHDADGNAILGTPGMPNSASGI